MTMSTFVTFLKYITVLTIFGLIIAIFVQTRDIKALILRDVSLRSLNEPDQHKCSCKDQNTDDTGIVRREKRLPQVLIIGIMKCGTYALNTMMEMHSKIVSTSSKYEMELDFFNLHYGRGLGWYRNQMPLSWPDQITLEKSPKYTQSTTNIVPQRMYSMNSSIRLIMVVKDPVTRAIGHYAHNDERGRYQQSFEKIAILPDGQVNSELKIIQFGIYETYLKLYLEFFSREQILVVDGDKLISNPVPILEMVERFLNLEPEITEDNFYFNEEKGFYCLKTNNDRGCLKKKKGRPHPEVDADVLRKLRVFFAPYNKRFYDLVGHDFGWETE